MTYYLETTIYLSIAIVNKLNVTRHIIADMKLRFALTNVSYKYFNALHTNDCRCAVPEVLHSMHSLDISGLVNRRHRVEAADINSRGSAVFHAITVRAQNTPSF